MRPFDHDHRNNTVSSIIAYVYMETDTYHLLESKVWA